MVVNLIQKYFKLYRDVSNQSLILILAGFISAACLLNTFFSIYLQEVKHLSVSYIGFIIAVSGFGLVFGSYAISKGRIFHNKYLLPLSLIGFALTMLLIIYLKSPILIYLDNFISYFCLGIFRTSKSIILINNSTEDNRNITIAIDRQAFNAGLAFGAFLCGLMVKYSFNYFLCFSAFSCILISIALYCFMDKTKKNNITPKNCNNSINIVFRDRIFLAICLIFFINCIIIYQLRATYSLFLRDMYHLSVKQISGLFFINFMLIIIFEMPIINKLKRHNQLKVSMYGLLMLGLGFFVLSFGKGFYMAIISILIITIGEILGITAFYLLPVKYSNEDTRNQYVNFFHIISYIGLIASPIFGTQIYNIDKGVFLWIICGILSIGCIPIYVVLFKK